MLGHGETDEPIRLLAFIKGEGRGLHVYLHRNRILLLTYAHPPIRGGRAIRCGSQESIDSLVRLQECFSFINGMNMRPNAARLCVRGHWGAQ